MFVLQPAGIVSTPFYFNDLELLETGTTCVRLFNLKPHE